MKSTDKELSAIIRVEGGLADQGLLDMYDAASMIHGLARGINIVGHAFANDQEIRSRANTAHGIKTLIHSSRKVCFEEQIDIVFSSSVASRIGPTVLTNNFWDYLEFSWSAAVGISVDPRSSNLKKVLDANADFALEIGDALESAMQEIHKPIAHERKHRIFLERPRVGDILELNKKTLDFVTTREEKTKRFEIVGNVTRFNVLSDFGRLFSDNEGRVVSFRLSGPDDGMRQQIVQSMKNHVDGLPNKLKFKVSEVLSSSGQVKRYVVYGVSEL